MNQNFVQTGAARVLLATILIATNACSFVFAEGRPNCSSYASPILDTVGTALFLGLASVAADNAEKSGNHNPVLIDVTGAGLFLSSAIYGYRKVGQCD